VRDAPATLLDASAGIRSSGCASAFATRSTRTSPTAAPPACSRRSPIGDQGAIERDDWDLFRNTGVAHLMSISGLHVTMFAWLAGA
jgi:competence protein ComEC